MEVARRHDRQGMRRFAPCDPSGVPALTSEVTSTCTVVTAADARLPPADGNASPAPPDHFTGPIHRTNSPGRPGCAGKSPADQSDGQPEHAPPEKPGSTRID